MMTRLSRLVRLFMLALALAFAAAQPAAAQSVLRDSETELLFRDMSKPLIIAAGLDPEQHQDRPAQRSGNQRLRRRRAGRLHPLRPADRGRQRQPAAGRDRARAWPCRRRPRHPHRRRRQGGDRHLDPVAGPRRRRRWPPARATPAMGIMAAGQQAAMGNFLSFTRAQESSADLAGANYLSTAGISGKGSLEFFKKLQNQEYRLAIYAKDSYDRTHPLSSERIATPARKSTRRTRRGTARPIPRSKRASSGSRPSCSAMSTPSARPRSIPKATRAFRPIMPAPTPIISAPIPTKRCRRPTPCSPPRRDDPFFLELKGQILLESGKPAEALAPLRARGQAGARPADDRGHARPRADRDRRAGQFRRGQAGAQDRGQPRQRQSLRLVPARHRL